MQIQSYHVTFLVPKWSICLNKNFFWKSVNKPCSFYTYPFSLSTFQKSLAIKEYWNLIGQEPFLAITWEPDFSQPCSFHRMFMNQKNFPFTPISDKTNDLIFLKSPKTLFLGHFWQFLVILPDGNFSKNSGSVTHNSI